MLSYLLRRLLYAPLIILGVMVLTFVIFFVVQKPETMARNVLGRRATPQTVQDWLHVRGYDKPLFLNTAALRRQPAVLPSGQPSVSDGVFDTIFFNQMWKLATFDLGVSDVTGRDLKSVFAEGAIPSLLLMLPAYLVGFLMATGFALYLVFVRKSKLDTAGVIVCVALMSIPSMVYVIFGQAVVALSLNYFPAFGFELQGWSSARFLLLPIALVIIVHLGSDVRLYRAVFLEEIAQDYVRTAQAKGVSNTRLLFVHVLKNGMIALITLVVANLPLLILGSLIVENFFGIPGLGNQLVNAIQTSDLAVVRATTFLTSILYIIGLTLTDIGYAVVDPRIRLS
jgi:peptide/nickel transport system permease protein